MGGTDSDGGRMMSFGCGLGGATAGVGASAGMEGGAEMGGGCKVDDSVVSVLFHTTVYDQLCQIIDALLLKNASNTWPALYIGSPFLL